MIPTEVSDFLQVCQQMLRHLLCNSLGSPFSVSRFAILTCINFAFCCWHVELLMMFEFCSEQQRASDACQHDEAAESSAELASYPCFRPAVSVNIVSPSETPPDALMRTVLVGSSATGMPHTNTAFACIRKTPNAAWTLHCVLQHLGEVHYLDAGLNCRGAHLTDPQMLQGLSQFVQQAAPRISIHLHGTPRQWGESQKYCMLANIAHA